MTRMMLIGSGRLSSLHGPGACTVADNNHLASPDGFAKEGWIVYDSRTGSFVSNCLKDAIIEDRSEADQPQCLHLWLHQNIEAPRAGCKSGHHLYAKLTNSVSLLMCVGETVVLWFWNA